MATGIPVALAGIKMVQTCSIYKLLPPLFNIPIEPIIDLVPGITPLRVTFDLIDSEDISLNYTVTEHTLQDFSNATSNVHRDLQRFTISGIMTSSLQIPTPVPVPATAGGSVRFDLVRIANLEAIAETKQPVMVVTPRFALRCFIENISRPWSPDVGENTEVSITCVEARILSPASDLADPAFADQVPGNNEAGGGGNESGAPSNSTAQPSSTQGAAPA